MKDLIYKALKKSNISSLIHVGGHIGQEVDFYKTLTPLSESNTTNSILTNYPELYLYGALAESSPFLMQDERLNTWAGLYKEALANANLSSQKGSITSSPMQMSATGII